MATKMILVILLALSCSSLQSGEFKEVTLALKDQDWRWCSLELDGPQKADLGWCWIGKECRKRVLRSDECRSKPYFCAAGDIPCIKERGLSNKTLVTK
jgi:hypothetical protein